MSFRRSHKCFLRSCSVLRNFYYSPLSCLFYSATTLLFAMDSVYHPFDVSCLGIYFLNKKGAFRLGTILFVNILILMVFIFSWTAGGIKAPAIQFFPFPVLIAVLLLGKRAGLLIACEAALCGLMLVVCDHFGILPSSTISHTTVSLWLISVLCITLLALLESISLSALLTRSNARRRN